MTHHPVTAINADEIVVLDKGVIAEQGTYNELTKDDTAQGIFLKMVQAGNE